MSWLCLERVVGAYGTVSYSFGEGSYVKKFYLERKSSLILENNTVSAWRVSTGRTPNFRQNRVMYRASQCCDSEGPMMPPDVYFGEEAVHWPAADLAGEYNSRLARANSARRDGRHYAPSCHHYRLPERCWIIDPTLTHNVDLRWLLCWFLCWLLPWLLPWLLLWLLLWLLWREYLPELGSVERKQLDQQASSDLMPHEICTG
jgi:hypothetical protein